MTVEQNSSILVKYISYLSNFRVINPGYPYNHMGATITDAILQAGVSYESVVKPRVNKVIKYPEAKETSGFLKLLNNSDPYMFLNWKGRTKVNRILFVTRLFVDEKIETETQLQSWLRKKENVSKLKSNKTKKTGVGEKTLAYFRMLSGINGSAVDRHLRKFLRLAGIQAKNDLETQEIINGAAKLMNLGESVLDHSIWKYMSEGLDNTVCTETFRRNQTAKQNTQSKKINEEVWELVKGKILTTYGFEKAVRTIRERHGLKDREVSYAEKYRVIDMWRKKGRRIERRFKYINNKRTAVYKFSE